MHKYEVEVLVPESQEKVFDFFNRPENLVRLMPPFMKFSLLTPGKLVTKVGAVFDYQVRVFGVQNRWTTYISEYEAPHRFVDIQLKGPHSFWHHEHEFKSTEEGTLVIDKIHYLLPLGILGRVANKIIMEPIVKALFRHRLKVMQDVFNEALR